MREPLSLRVTNTGVEVIEGDCPHCGHPAIEHWPDGCRGGRGGHDHCRMDAWKFKRLIAATPPEPNAQDRAERKTR